MVTSKSPSGRFPSGVSQVPETRISASVSEGKTSYEKADKAASEIEIILDGVASDSFSDEGYIKVLELTLTVLEDPTSSSPAQARRIVLAVFVP